MNIALINGSPKIKNSASGILLTGLKQQIANTASVIDIGFHTMTVSEQPRGTAQRCGLGVCSPSLCRRHTVTPPVLPDAVRKNYMAATNPRLWYHELWLL